MKKLRRILIANRGEIAVRIIRACHERGLESVAVLSDADTESLHVKLADQAVRIGSGPVLDSYLNGKRIIEAAKQTKADAIHPGYGFLSENADFAQAVQKAGIQFIGPSPQAIRAMGNKTQARKKMIQTNVPVVPGSKGNLANLEEAQKVSKEIGFPILIKAVSGGGGRGMRIVHKKSNLKEALEGASREAKSAFGDGSVYMERYLKNPPLSQL